MIIDTARPRDWPAIVALLARCGLPVAGLDLSQHLVLVARAEDALIGCAGIEQYHSIGLLRSVAVAPEHQSQGIGKQLMATILHEAEIRAIRDLYLLTESAATYFPSWGFVGIARDQVPDAIQQTVEYREACAVSAVVMHRDISMPA